MVRLTIVHLNNRNACLWTFYYNLQQIATCSIVNWSIQAMSIVPEQILEEDILHILINAIFLKDGHMNESANIRKYFRAAMLVFQTAD